ncbi:acetate--CoA ligase family protein [Sulfitobacter donghicola]|uniref:Acyl-CoA synthetase n=1 Tax=Sulfitobacter donghicola DSW-25 = KCTC 12864 = JCM 14565 TaxID=1300350 RepID=A0A073IU47_9RHOB|nr:acetate--CoA ligase family protein [Sulfitobacter donghicola]KEJ88917.1 acyl-CoA synthetase [Sulfitobacter donghicola DSW-25 = KCTC 12864 = JCM 14565]KIN67539.1 Acyl-CoA synthetase [Sulfitobacter donghicola DSW-25 = KCTC 12864 = JCM 14565]
MKSLSRFFSPKAVVVIGGGTWCESVVRQCRDTGFTGPIWPVHPKKAEVGGLPAYPDLASLPGVPDAAFIGVNRALTVSVTAELSALGCSGAVCFAAGFSEAVSELTDGAELQAQLVEAAGKMSVLGPNCYGIVNALDGMALWPDRHGMTPVDSGVAIVGQSSNVLINLTMQRRGLPLAAVVAAGNQAQATMSDLGIAFLEDPRITALGLHIEGISDLPAFEELARRASELGKPIVALRVGSSEQAQAAAVSHTASLTGSDSGARALLKRLGIAQVDTPTELIETLKLLHVTGGLRSSRIASASCSGGEASLMADMGEVAGVIYPQLDTKQTEGLRAALGPKVALANPLDYNTYIWGDEAALTATFTALCDAALGLGCVVLDYPRDDRFNAPEYDQVLRAIAKTREVTGTPMAMVSLLAEGLPEAVAQRALDLGVVPLCGMGNALRAICAAAEVGARVDTAKRPAPVLQPLKGLGDPRVFSEAEAKALLSSFGVRVPQSQRAMTAAEAGTQAAKIGFPVVLKGEGIAHKTEAGAVVLNLTEAGAVTKAAETMPAKSFLVEEMITGTVAELIVGVTRDPAHGFVLTMGMGGILTELIRDTVSLIIPAGRDEVRSALSALKTGALLTGYRGRAPANLDAVLDTVMGLQALVGEHVGTLHEIEINPLICRTKDAVAADALIRMEE